jgi:hypothetical protein
MLVIGSATPFGGFQEDAVSILGPILGKDRVLSFVSSMRADVRREAEAGARKAIPDITSEVERTAARKVTPLVGAAIGAGLLGAALGGIAYYRTRK